MALRRSALCAQYYCLLVAACILSKSSTKASADPHHFPHTFSQHLQSQRILPSFIHKFISPHKELAFTSFTRLQQYPQYSSAPISSTTRLCMSSPPSSSSRQSYGKRTQQRQTTRNRGANAANRNRRGHLFRLNNKDDGAGGKKNARRGSNTKRAPRWEREGDKLYAEVTKQLDAYKGSTEHDASERLLSLADQQITSVQDVCHLLEPWMATDEQLQEAKETKSEPMPKIEDENTNKSPPFLWGTLPIGPVLASRLHATERSSPTSVQRASFPILTAGHSKGNKKIPTKRTNAIIASPTGTGKTLAYLLPLLCTSPGGQMGEGSGGVLIVTPTIELACQIQREVDVLWPPLGEELDCRSSLFVVGADDSNDNMQNIDNDDEEDLETISPGRITLRSIQHAPLIAGTPKMLRMLYREAGRIVTDRNNDDATISEEERATSKALLSNLRAVVLDEADRLLRTEAVARETTERKQRKIAQRKIAEAKEAAIDGYIPPPPPMKKKRLIIARQTQTELLLRDLPIPSLDDVQIICASATIGRTMRRQLMQILDAPSADSAATLVTGDEDERVKSKDAERRKSVLLPEKLQHAYRVVDEAGSLESEELLEELPDDVQSTAGRNEEKRVGDTMSALWDTMMSMEEAKPIIIFPGRVGVDRVQRELLAHGLSDVRTLRNLDGMSPETGIEIDAADLIISHDHDWKSVPVYVIGERFARGLDLPDVEYVILLAPPSSAAGYAHMAGRTGRSGRVGTAITLVRPKNNEVQRLAAIADALGLKFAFSSSGVAGKATGQITMQVIENDVHSTISEPTSSPWELLSESALRRKRNSELYDYLVSSGETINKSSKKEELVAAVQLLHSKR